MNENQSNQSQNTSIDLTNFTKDLFSDKVEYDLNKDPNSESFFEPIPNNFYGFCIPIPAFSFSGDCVESDVIVIDFPDTIDIEFEDVTIKKIA